MDSLTQLKNNDKVKSLLDNSSAFNRANLLKGYEGIWIEARRTNSYYIINKVISICIAFFFAAVTLSVKRTTLIYQQQMNSETTQTGEAFHIRTIYWFLFIYYSLAGMDELIEMFSVINELEKGALGLFFELNYLIGAFLTGYITWFVMKFDPPKYNEELFKNKATSSQGHYDHMFNWIYVQFCYMFFCVFMVLVVSCLYKRMNNQALKMKPAHGHHDEDEDEKKTNAIN